MIRKFFNINLKWKIWEFNDRFKIFNFILNFELYEDRNFLFGNILDKLLFKGILCG